MLIQISGYKVFYQTLPIDGTLTIEPNVITAYHCSMTLEQKVTLAEKLLVKAQMTLKIS